MKKNISLNLNRFWFFRYKIYHFPFWGFYHLLLGVLQFNLVDVVTWLFFSSRYIIFLSYVFLHTFAVYFNLYYLLPRFMEKGKLVKYIVYLLLCIIVAGVCTTFSHHFAVHITGHSFGYFAYPYTGKYHFFTFLFTKAIPSVMGVMLLAMTIKLTQNWSKAKKRQQVLEKEKLETELNFLKSQFNPHFLFNTINSIFFLIHKDPRMASTALAKFSELLRYQLYECNEVQIPLSNEISYLKNVVTLEKLRKNDDLKVNFEIDQQNKEHLSIASFILMPFVENAFKHVSKHKAAPNWIEIKLGLRDGQRLVFEVLNSKSEAEETSQEAVKYGGIGLKNVKRRLALIYPEQYNLAIEDKGSIFEVRLQLQVSELLAPAVPKL